VHEVIADDHAKIGDSKLSQSQRMYPNMQQRNDINMEAYNAYYNNTKDAEQNLT
jgi:hypothetical protein